MRCFDLGLWALPELPRVRPSRERRNHEYLLLTYRSRSDVQRPRRGCCVLNYVLIGVVTLRAFERSEIEARFSRLGARQNHRGTALGTRQWLWFDNAAE